MINYLFQLGLSENDIKKINDFDDKLLCEDIDDIEKIVFLLKDIGMNENSIKEMIICNPMILNRTYEDVNQLILKLKEYNFDSINFLLEANPFFVNYDAYEIDDYYNLKNERIQEITDSIENNPYIMEEY
jgi:hypothetical protein